MVKTADLCGSGRAVVERASNETLVVDYANDLDTEK